MSVLSPLLGATPLEDPCGRLRLGRCPQGPRRSWVRLVYVADWPSDPGDVEILENAYQGARILVTLDKDFGELAIVRGLAHSGIVRLVALSISKQVEVCLSALARYGALLESGAIVTAEAGRVRVRPPDERE